ncbi:MAG: diaminopimelate decarboxylase [Pelagibacteraceae bacterium BACL5 MAG-120705-bin12]|jgi:diaminopimelate decarboxylase|uniref:diaminopimelate decarboxylase n=1 Tax=Candidatus Pelagibacter sp. TaxID=2024849 RepID=UPI0007153C2A|nr:MAG: diaminopimelate decarboxylase [Pelagibacteraceae bacterium BACL5 MAG-121015-bin10]KRO60409.1 MAG: diaminopimelate decarboxylase [Pelagibacteraceae bacterium BACL5 MAG-121128-bin54]KRO61195.1 MAG: diaminopimelate decarboxylase [Pelagibacteraceae bacterium BACL5 MAG-120705-bin12]KRO65005.1 MAG: diaminopimelate decarboxylase [Pelagibacteraceae bacterium BACL5 MAG-120820-bin39]MDA1166670.1 diaminopimelate decarboxylase [Pseudomonadota bacterium]
MKYLGQEFFIEKIKAKLIAKKFGTPAYCYSYSRLKENIENLQKNFKSFNPLFCFAVKSNTNKYLLNEIGKFGFGADVVSLGELIRAISAGISPNKIVFSGVGKTAREIEYAINKKILLINAESKSEILQIEKIAKLKKKTINIGIRLNPNTDAKTLKEISTGKKENKFGVNEKTFLELVNYIKNSKNLNLKCLSVHIGSQILDDKPYLKMLNVLDKVIRKSNHKFEYVDLGGGMGIDYDHNNKKLNLKKYNSYIQKFLKVNSCKIIFEPGRSIIGDTAVLITNITYIKESDKKDFIILDAGMNDLMRPALYKAEHKIIPIVKKKIKSKKIYEFVGPICETTDKFLTIKNYQKLNENDLIVIYDVGAYGMSLSSNYNLRPKPIELLIHNSKIKIINKRQKLSELV